jgi:hypothetical protein
MDLEREYSHLLETVSNDEIFNILDARRLSRERQEEKRID